MTLVSYYPPYYIALCNSHPVKPYGLVLCGRERIDFESK